MICGNICRNKIKICNVKHEAVDICCFDVDQKLIYPCADLAGLHGHPNDGLHNICYFFERKLAKDP